MTQDSQTPEQTKAPQELSFLDRAEQALENLGDDVKGVFEELVNRAKELFGVGQSTVQETLQKDVIDPASSLAQDATQVAEHAQSEVLKSADELNQKLSAALAVAQQDGSQVVSSVEAAINQEGAGTAVPVASVAAPTASATAEPTSAPVAEPAATTPVVTPSLAPDATAVAPTTTTPAA